MLAVCSQGGGCKRGGARPPAVAGRGQSCWEVDEGCAPVESVCVYTGGEKLFQIMF